jgi:hypothetical membrane protein
MQTLPLMLAFLSATMAAFVPVYFGRRKPGYSHVRHTISELGEIGSPVGAIVSYGGFLATGILVWLFVLVSVRTAPDAPTEPLYLLALVGAGYVGGGVFRCDAGAPAFGSWRNSLHNLFGAGEYVGAAGAFASLQADDYWSPLSTLMGYAAIVVLVCLWGISFPHPWRGLIQRIAETTIFGGVVLMGWWMFRMTS